ncbi:UNVERIFIED_CONTAM: UTP--glucose-1-phosphate uridylyltransferase [Sesamum latifolium]|uniref:UTP--glucose-1-phosphate uridylyltransferase n=1 Tax=Sesamum latifolium TaxID=2727402 RepID=A0AAW2YG38_9LAMI
MAEVDETSTTRGDVGPVEQIDRTVKKFVFPYENLQGIPEDISEAKQVLDKLVVLKFNGSLGTKIGFNGPKCTMEIGGGLTCLDLIINQIETLNAEYGCNIPLLLVNAANAHEGVLKVLEKHSNKNVHSVIQSQHHLESVSEFEPASAKGEDNQDEMYGMTVLLLLQGSCESLPNFYDCTIQVAYVLARLGNFSSSFSMNTASISIRTEK